MNKIFTVLMASVLMLTGAGCANAQKQASKKEGSSLPKVYFIKDITSENLIKIYEALGRKAEGKNVAVKLSTGEAGNPNYLQPALIKDLVQMVKGTIIEGNTAYGGKRTNVADHIKVAEEHGFTAIADVDIMDADGQVELPVNGGKHLKVDIVGKDFLNYDFMVVLSHFKGHPMAGFGGALKNISIGIASPEGKAYIHSGGKTRNVTEVWNMIPADTIFQESMRNPWRKLQKPSLTTSATGCCTSVWQTTFRWIATVWPLLPTLRWAISASSLPLTQWLSTVPASMPYATLLTTEKYTLSNVSTPNMGCTIWNTPNSLVLEARNMNL